MSRRGRKTHPLFLVPPLLAFAVFMIYLLQIKDQPFVRYLVANPLVYEDQAQRILEGAPRLQPFFLSPLYPPFMALAYALSSGSRLFLLIFQGLLLAVTVGLLGAVCSRLLSRAVGLAAMLIMVFYWSFYYFAGEVLPTTLCLTFLLAGLLLFLERGERLHPVAVPSLAFAGTIMAVYALPGLKNLGSLIGGVSLPASPRAYWGSLSLLVICIPAAVAGLIAFSRIRALRQHVNLFASGITMGVSMLVWSGVSVAAGLFALSMLGQRDGKVVRLGVFCLGISVCVAASMTHNRLISGDLVPITSSFGVNLFIGNNASSDGMNPFNLGEADEVRIEADKQRLSGAARSAFFRERATSFIRQQPGHWLEIMGRKALISVSRFPIDNNAHISERREAWSRFFLPGLHFGIILPLALAGIIYSLRANRRAYVLVLGFAGFLTVNILFFVAERFRLPAALFLIPLSAAGLCGLFGDAITKRWSRLGIAAALLAGGALLANVDYLGLSNLEFPSIVVNRAHIARLSGDHAGARALLEQALEREPENAGAYFQLGALEQAEGNPVAAIAHYLESLRRDPFFYAAYSRSQKILEENGISPTYIDDYVAAILGGSHAADLRRRLIQFVAGRTGRTGSDLEN